MCPSITYETFPYPIITYFILSTLHYHTCTLTNVILPYYEIHVVFYSIIDYHTLPNLMDHTFDY